MDDDNPLKVVLVVAEGIAAVLTAAVALGKAIGELTEKIDN